MQEMQQIAAATVQVGVDASALPRRPPASHKERAANKKKSSCAAATFVLLGAHLASTGPWRILQIAPLETGITAPSSVAPH